MKRRKGFKRSLSLAACALIAPILMTGCYYDEHGQLVLPPGVTAETIQNLPQEVLEMLPAEVVQGLPASGVSFTPGTFTGVGSGGFGGDITVDVTFDENRIVNVEITDHSESTSWMNRVRPIVPNQIVERQSTQNVDVLTRATLSTNAIVNAVNDAIRQAGADPAALTPQTPAAPVSGARFITGQYTTVGTGGFGGDVTVTTVFSRDRIERVEIGENSESTSWMNRVEPVVPNQIVERQSTQDVDVLTRATMTTTAIVNAVNEAIRQAGADPAALTPQTLAAPVSGATFITGQYTTVGTGGFGGDITVNTVFSRNRIERVEIVDHNETESFMNRVQPILPNQIVERQSTQDVDVLTRATMTTTAIVNAVNEAIRQAGADPAALDPQALTEPVGGARFITGQFTGVGEGGFGGNITVNTVFSANRIERIEIVDHSETQSFIDRVVPYLPDQIIERQSTQDVDAISNATATVNAIINAVNDSITQAGADPTTLDPQ